MKQANRNIQTRKCDINYHKLCSLPIPKLESWGLFDTLRFSCGSRNSRASHADEFSVSKTEVPLTVLWLRRVSQTLVNRRWLRSRVQQEGLFSYQYSVTACQQQQKETQCITWPITSVCSSYGSQKFTVMGRSWRRPWEDWARGLPSDHRVGAGPKGPKCVRAPSTSAWWMNSPAEKGRGRWFTALFFH